MCKSKNNDMNDTQFFIAEFGTKWCISHFSATMLQIVPKIARIPGGTGLWGVQKCVNYGTSLWKLVDKRTKN